MCRHVAYLGPPVSLRSLLIDPPHGLYRQAWAPRLQKHGTVNADGFGAGWYADGDPLPARYRRAVPIWGDPSLHDIARVTRSPAVLAAVRCATPGTDAGEAAAAPFAADRWLFSHNGTIMGWPAAAEKLVDRMFPPASRRGVPVPAGGIGALLSMEAMVDSAFLWALVLRELRAGVQPGLALAETIEAIQAAGGSGRFNFLLTDGHSITATACGDTLWYRVARDTVTVASEPCDDDPGWTEVPDRYVLTAAAGHVDAVPLPGLAESGNRAESDLTEGAPIP